MSGILITGAGKRIGKQLALDLAEAGHDIAVHYNGSKSGIRGMMMCICRGGVWDKK